MRPIVQQSAFVSYSPFLALPAPKIAGLLPATTGTSQQSPPGFTYTNPHMAELPDDRRERLFEVARTLLDVAVGRALGEFNDHALNTALTLFRSTVTGQPSRPANPAQYNAEMDAPLLEWLVSSLRREVRYE